jgi:hypothetical protein
MSRTYKEVKESLIYTINLYDEKCERLLNYELVNNLTIDELTTLYEQNEGMADHYRGELLLLEGKQILQIII